MLDLDHKQLRVDNVNALIYVEKMQETIDEALKQNIVDGAPVLNFITKIEYGKEKYLDVEETDEVAKIQVK